MKDDLQPLLSPINSEMPAGADLEYDPDFARMEKSAQGTPDQEYGDTKIEGTPPDWADVRKACLSVLSRSKDLRAATYWAEAELSTKGILPFRDCLHVISVFVNEFWGSVFPLLDADDDDDPTSRINSLARFCNSGGMIRALRLTTILSSREVGRFSWTDCAIAKGELPAPNGMDDPPTQKKINAAVQKADLAELKSMAGAVNESLNFVAQIESGFSERLGAATGPNLELLTKELKAISRFYKSWLAEREGPETTSDKNELIEFQSESNSQNQGGGGIAQRIVVSGEFIINKRDDAIDGLDKIIGWFEKNEPSSPLPMLLRRAKRLSTMSFLDILRDISPEGVNQAVVIGGPGAEEVVEVKQSNFKNDESPRATHRPSDDY